MVNEEMTSMERVLTTLGQEEPDRVPYFLLLTMHGAKELGMSIKEYFSRPEYVAKGQIRMRERYGHDCYYPFYYASLETEAWGGKTIFYEDGPANAGAPFIKSMEDIESLEAPDVWDSPQLLKVLKTIELLKEDSGEDVPIIGVVMSPFSVPPMQLGFSKYFDLMYENRELFNRLMGLNTDFCIEWANAQLEAGATTICYFDPISSPTIVPKELYMETGKLVEQKVISSLKGPAAVHLASGSALPIIDDIADTGASVVCTSATEDLAEVKAACKGRMSVLGNLNGIDMRNWTVETTEYSVREAIDKAAKGGGFILSDNHGEIPCQVPHEVLMAISDAVRKYGNYPINR
ncbi:uroporphyrinogen decarboxylase [Methanococcoides methylutens]|uniref:Uroporphyrinogen decarboxylase n=1 Tax=Methanococcoides methylutens TaxID=2226 RepID=A0A099SYA7_METMT|nr:uroporphyrinogen decarboxylase family protein [Methanococcoides methylutens]KGK97915.1 uroporphyrinogen decarboxylase [Methanococcoides methylutens]